ncbi:MAG: CapA family protein [Clostridia bacterium]
MRRRKRMRRGLSLGSVAMLTLTALVLVCFCALLPKFTGHIDVRTNAANLAVAIDHSLAQIASVSHIAKPNNTALPPPVEKVPPPSVIPTEPPVTATEPPKYHFTLSAAGSLKCNSNVQKALTTDAGYQFDLLFDQLGQRMQADLSILTLEESVIPTAKLSDSNVPADLLTAIANAGVNAICMGHYGVLDGGVAGLAQTKQSIQAAGMVPYGAYASAAERAALTLQNINGVSVALLSYQNKLTANGKKRVSKDELSFAIASQQLPTIAQDISTVRDMGAQVVIVSLCWGKSGATSPTKTQQELAQGIADAGADVILGTHPEALQAVEILTANRGDNRYHPVLCAYSLGNFFTYDRDKRASLASILLQAEVVYDSGTDTVAFDQLSYTPIYSWRGKQDGKTRYRTLINTDEYADFVDKDQKNVMERCLTLVTDVMEKSPILQQR